MRLIVGLVGEMCAGKGTFIEFFQRAALSAGYQVEVVRTGGLLKDTLDLWSIEQTRENLQALAIGMERIFGEGTLTSAMRSKITKINADIGIYDAIRWQSDYDLIRSFAPFIYSFIQLVIYITADQEVRWRRALSRREKIGEDSVTLEQFSTAEEQSTETDIVRLGGLADYRIVNNGHDLNLFHRQVSEFFEKFIENRIA